MARPRIDIDKDAFETSCQNGAKLEELAAKLRCSPDTIERWCKRTYKKSFSEVRDFYKQALNLEIRDELRNRMYKSDKVLMYMANNMLGMSNDPARNKKDKADESKLEQTFDTINAVADKMAANVQFDPDFGKAEAQAETDEDTDHEEEEETEDA